MNITRIYLITNCYNDPNKVYIGKTVNSRKNDHQRKFGKQITYDYIDEINSINRKDWKPLECYWIEQFRSFGFELMNLNAGGNGISHHNEGSKKIMRLKRKNKGRKVILQYDLNGKFIKEWESVGSILIELKSKAPNISKSCKNPNHQIRGFLWRYKTENYPLQINPYIKPSRDEESRKITSYKLKGMSKPEGFGAMMREVRLGVPKPEGTGDKISKKLMGRISTSRKPVNQYDLEGKFIQDYPNIEIAATSTNSNPSTISKVCRGIFGKTNGFRWKFKDLDS